MDGLDDIVVDNSDKEMISEVAKDSISIYPVFFKAFENVQKLTINSNILKIIENVSKFAISPEIIKNLERASNISKKFEKLDNLSKENNSNESRKDNDVKNEN